MTAAQLDHHVQAIAASLVAALDEIHALRAHHGLTPRRLAAVLQAVADRIAAFDLALHGAAPLAGETDA